MATYPWRSGYRQHPFEAPAASAASCSGNADRIDDLPSARFSSVQARCCGSMRCIVEHMQMVGAHELDDLAFGFTSSASRLTRFSSVPTSQRVLARRFLDRLHDGCIRSADVVGLRRPRSCTRVRMTMPPGLVAERWMCASWNIWCTGTVALPEEDGGLRICSGVRPPCSRSGPRRPFRPSGCPFVAGPAAEVLVGKNSTFSRCEKAHSRMVPAFDEVQTMPPMLAAEPPSGRRRS